jgi:hypothetical protein
MVPNNSFQAEAASQLGLIQALSEQLVIFSSRWKMHKTGRKWPSVVRRSA